MLTGIDGAIGWLESEAWWGEASRDRQLGVPHAMLTGINPAWRQGAAALPVEHKKEIFYRVILPLIVHANGMVMQRRARLSEIAERLDGQGSVDPADIEFVMAAAQLVRVRSADEAGEAPLTGAELAQLVDDLLYRIDTIPNGLVLGQAAYESGYGTSRFAVEGNALFGQWTYGGEGLVPEQQRAELGDHRIAAYDWPFDSVRGYFINLMSHPAYEEFRRRRAELRAAGEELSSLVLADTLTSYSERGEEYVDTLKSIIRVNGLYIADGATFRDEPVRFLIGAESEADAAATRAEVERLRQTGELESIVARMRLD